MSTQKPAAANNREVDPSTTALIHHPYTPPDGFAAPQVGVHKASTVIFSNVAALRSRSWKERNGYTYGLHGTPTTFTLESRIASLESGTAPAHCVLAPSGLSAIALVNLALCKTRQQVLMPSNSYNPNKEMATGLLAGLGIAHQWYDPMNPADLAQRIDTALANGVTTGLVWLEAPGSITMEFPPLAHLVQVCRQRGVTSALDNTWGAGLAFNGFDLGQDERCVPGSGADVVMHALTKYPSGGGDVLMGSVVTRSDALHEQLRYTHMRLGMGVGANDVEAILRGLPTMALRYAAQDATARELATWLQTRPEVARVLHPALPGSPGHEHWQALTVSAAHPRGQAAGLFSIVFQPHITQIQADAFCDALRLFRIGYSWGGPVSLVVPYDLPAIRDGSNPYGGCVVRFSTGFEAVTDLQADLAQALAASAMA
jgi:cysteine-S-conjugate beta-lyase